jgi:hypothetical protein
MAQLEIEHKGLQNPEESKPYPASQVLQNVRLAHCAQFDVEQFGLQAVLLLASI